MNISKPLKLQLIAAAAFVLVCVILWLRSTQSAAYAMWLSPGHRIASYAESSSGCLMLGFMGDARAMNGLQSTYDFAAPLDQEWRVVFDLAFGGHLRPFTFVARRGDTGVTVAASLPYWFFITLAGGSASLWFWRARQSSSAVPPNHALQRTRPSHHCCNRGVPRAGSLSLGR